MHEQHVGRGAAEYGDQHLPFPGVEQGGDGNAYELGNAKMAGGELHVFQTIDDEHPENGGREHLAKIVDVAGCGLAAEDEKRHESRRCRGYHHCGYRYYLLCECHSVVV